MSPDCSVTLLPGPNHGPANRRLQPAAGAHLYLQSLAVARRPRLKRMPDLAGEQNPEIMTRGVVLSAKDRGHSGAVLVLLL